MVFAFLRSLRGSGRVDSGRGDRLAQARVPEGMRIYAIGDIHGGLHALRTLHRGIEEDSRQNGAGMENVIVYLGDYVDRGMHSREVIDYLLGDPMPGYGKVYLKGNHDDASLRFLEDASFGPTWFSYGGDATIFSYGVRMPANVTGPERFEKMREQFQLAIPPAHVDFLRNLQLRHEAGDYLFVHAGVKPGKKLDEQDAFDLMWIRDEFTDSNQDFGRIVVHGHTVTEAPDIRHNRIGIDTGAYSSGILTCLILEGDQRYFLATERAGRAGGANQRGENG